MDLISKPSKKNLVLGLSKIKFKKDKIYDACQKDKQTKSFFNAKNIVSTSKPLQLFYIDLFRPSNIASFGGNYYAFVIVDNFFRFI